MKSWVEVELYLRLTQKEHELASPKLADQFHEFENQGEHGWIWTLCAPSNCRSFEAAVEWLGKMKVPVDQLKADLETATGTLEEKLFNIGFRKKQT
jgi:hypothetical protein